VLCYEPKLFNILKENKLSYEKSSNPSSFSNCENLIAEEGSILFCSKQIKQDKPNELPIIVVFATTSQILAKKATVNAIKEIRRRYPDDITAIKYFEKQKKKTLPIFIFAFRRSLK
jgi:hypothetical protein